MKQLGLYARTLACLRPSQVAYFLQRRILPQFRSVAKTADARKRSGVSMLSGISVSKSTGDDSHFCFLRQSKDIPSQNADWACKDMPKLWRYNLHYFDYLHDPARSLENKSLLITDWMHHNPPDTEDAWEPYTVSLRIVNWVKWFLLMNLTGFEEGSKRLPRREWIDSLYQQALWLEQNIEYHILANHYLKNGIALFFAGAYFQGGDADRWLKKGVQILREELDEQFLADGGHFERSPMYHSICVTDYLDVLNLARHSQGVLSSEDQGTFAQRMTRSLDFLSDMCLPDQKIALFNDSAFGIALSPQHNFDYAKKIIGYEPSVRPSGLSIHSYASSGYYVCRKAEDKIIIDCGPIGPDYQPGHAHCDTLSYELAIDGQRVVVDSGVFDYEPSQERAYARSTRAHNTVMVDGEEQSEIWGVFRVARRARPLYAHIQANAHEVVLFEGAHDGYMRLSGRPIHRRRISYDDGETSWIITDVLEGTGSHRMESFVHIHPDCALVESGSNSFRIECCGEAIATIQALSACQATIELGCYFPEFGLRRENPVLAFSCHGEVPLQLSYRIQKTRDRQTQAHRHANPLPITLFPSRGERTCD